MKSVFLSMLRMVIVLGLLVGGGYVLFRYLPPEHNPFAPIDLNEPLGWATPLKLAKLRSDAEVCYAELTDAGVEFTRLPPDDPSKRCALENAMVLDKSLTPYSSAPLKLTCGETASIYLWERNFVRPLAEDILGSPVATIETYGSFSCRTIAGSSRMSQHAYANAIDIWGFRLEDGRLITVKDHWREDGPNGEFLDAVHEGACGLFSVLLGPDYNAAHADHFHMDMGPSRICR